MPAPYRFIKTLHGFGDVRAHDIVCHAEKAIAGTGIMDSGLGASRRPE
jgi:hypothetical protein